uniref:Uncharacterized protein LOC114344216 n=1 Tax=Diabrotica virgifera virgifera TaxID=50390 RepID=A0A6P7GMJ4_DIAVI
MEMLKQPKAMSVSGDMAVNWKKFKNSFELYSIATGCKEKSQQIQAAVFLHCIGEDVLDHFELSLNLTEAEKQNYEVLIKKFEKEFVPQSNLSVESHKFNRREQEPGESFDSFLGDLRRLASGCDFGALKDRLVKDRIVIGIRDKKTKDRLLRETNLSLAKTIEICKAAEQTEEYVRQLMDKTNTLEVSDVRKRNLNRSQGKQQLNSQQNTNYQRGNQNVARGSTAKCGRCGRSHVFNACPAMGKQCTNCYKYNHFNKFCFYKNNVRFNTYFT